MLKDWFIAKGEGAAFWLVDSQSHAEAVKEFGFGFEDSRPLFEGEMFSSVKDFSPWLIPVTEEVLSLQEETLNRCIGVLSEHKFEEVVEHLQSLLTASLEGEEVLFRFYDSKVVLQMLKAMDKGELASFMGNISEIAFFDDEIRVFSNTPKPDFKPQSETWWKILPHHLVELYNIKAHAHAIERRWWELLPQLMEKLDTPSVVLIGALQKGIDAGFKIEKLEYGAMVELAKITGTHISEFSIPFHLTFEELKELETIKESWV
ncbi:DUF4123 domain-containing protein [Vibrio europaeus]|uniref:DUF4123 domain-containing protein n=1 Tax=Vibrio europaeus TaxID=300876 RepID=UPI00233FDA5D|nr:DUF4123 domain-containing protein [Vibrio europaeus]MDC5848493.1 DUF4123 domain-containing protein [Vibrio europaeus]